MKWSVFVSLYAIALPLFLLIDALWLKFIAKDFYASRLTHLLGEVNWTAAALFYPLYLVGVIFFAVYPATLMSSWKMAALYGGLFGFFTYLTYDLTNLATLKDWPTSVVVVDILWGVFVGSVVSAATVAIYLSYKSV